MANSTSRDIYHAVIGDHEQIKSLSQDALTEYRDSCGDACMGIVSALTALGSLSMCALESENYLAEDCPADMRRISCALRHLPRLMEALNHNRESADYELSRREAAK